MTDKQIAHWLRLAFGVAIAAGLGIDSFINGRSLLWTYGLPGVVLLLTIADFARFLMRREHETPGLR